MKKYVVTCVDYGDTCDGKARVLGIYNTRGDAFNNMNLDMHTWYDEYKNEGVEMDFDKMSSHFDYNTNAGCEWNIEEVEIEDEDDYVSKEELMNQLDKILDDENGEETLKERICKLEREVANLKDRIKYRF